MPLEATNYYSSKDKIELGCLMKGVCKYLDCSAEIVASCEGQPASQGSDLALALLMMSIDRYCNLSLMQLHDQGAVQKPPKST